MFEGNYQLEIKVAANTSKIKREKASGFNDPRPEHRGWLWDVVARLGSVLVRLGTSMERLALLDEKIHADV